MFVLINFTSICINILYFSNLLFCKIYFFLIINFSNDFVYVLAETEVSVR
jgi:hypothetical protein